MHYKILPNSPCITLASGTWTDRGWPGPKPGLKARVSAGLWPGWPGDKKSGEAPATGPAWPGQAMADRGQNWHNLALLKRKRKNLGLHGLECPGQAGAKQWPSLPRNLGQPGQDQIKLESNLLQARLHSLEVYLSSDMKYNYSTQAARPQNLSVALI